MQRELLNRTKNSRTLDDGGLDFFPELHGWVFQIRNKNLKGLLVVDANRNIAIIIREFAFVLRAQLKGGADLLNQVLKGKAVTSVFQEAIRRETHDNLLIINTRVFRNSCLNI